jgi:hypothetical protein
MAVMYDKPVFTMQFIWKFWLFMQLFKNPHEVMLKTNLWSGCNLEDVENELKFLKESLLNFEHNKDVCDETFKCEINSFIEDLGKAVRLVKNQELIQFLQANVTD